MGDKILYPYLCKGLLDRNVSNDISLETYKLRKMNEIMKDMQLSMKDIFELRSKTYVHPQCSAEIKRVLDTFPVSLTKEEEKIVKIALASDYHDREDLIRFANLMSVKTADYDELAHHMNRIFAVDGFAMDFNYRNYIDNLRHRLTEEIGEIYRDEPFDPFNTHIEAVRLLYAKFLSADVSPSKVHDCILEAYRHTSPLPELGEPAKSYKNYFGTMFDRVKQDVIKPQIEKEAKNTLEGKKMKPKLNVDTDDIVIDVTIQ